MALLLLLVLLTPSLWKLTGKNLVRPLDGAYVNSGTPALSGFSWSEWFDNSFQSRFSDQINQHIGMHDFFVRLYNQLNWSLFRSVSAEGVVAGKEDMLFEYDYIRAMLGEDYLGEQILDRQIRRMRRLQEYLMRQHNTCLLFLFEPSKVRFYPEYLPTRFISDNENPTNYSVSLDLCQKYGLHYIDFNAFFDKEKGQHPYPLYTKYGTHWSEYGMHLALDSLLTYLRMFSGHNIPEVTIENITGSRQPQKTDYDLGYLLNLLTPLRCEVMGYPRYGAVTDTAQIESSVLAVGDSYYFNIFNTEAKSHFFAQHNFWYYNKHIYPEQYSRESLVEEVNLREELSSVDIILVTVTERFLYKNLWGFADLAYGAFFATSVEEPFYHALNQILSTDSWFNEILEEAKIRHIPPATLLEQHAAFMVYENDRKSYILSRGAEYFENTIRFDEKWSAMMLEKAKEKGKTPDEVIAEDALYIFKKNHPEWYEQWLFIMQVKEDMLNTPHWMDSLREKARSNYLTLEEMMQLDAEYLWAVREK